MSSDMKRLLWFPLLIFSLGVVGTSPVTARTDTKPKPSAQELLNAAIKNATAENKAVMVRFSASWCGWCKRLDAFLHSPEVGKLMTENYILVELTVQERGEKKALENPGADAVMEKMGAAEAGLPYYLFLDKDGKKMSKSLGNTLNVEDLLKNYGADVLRWWVSSLPFENDIKVDLSFFDTAGETLRASMAVRTCSRS